MAKITVYKIRLDGVFDGEIELEVNDPEKSGIPAFHTRKTPHPIPADHYAVMRNGWEYVKGAAPELHTQPNVPPQRVTMRQARLALFNQNLLSQVNSALNSIPDEAERTKSQIEWEYATEVLRSSPLVSSLGSALKLTDQQIDSLFELAITL